MFNKTKKTVVEFTFDLDGYSGSSTSVPLKDRGLFEYLKELRKRHGRIVIDFIDNDNIHVTSVASIKKENFEERINDVTEIIRQYAKGQAIEMEAYAVFAKGELKSVFGQEVHSRLKKSSLLREGFEEEDIEIKSIQIGSFQNIL